MFGCGWLKQDSCVSMSLFHILGLISRHSLGSIPCNYKSVFPNDFEKKHTDVASRRSIIWFLGLNFLIHIDLDLDANPFPLEDRPVRS